jgi:exonuclease-1
MGISGLLPFLKDASTNVNIRDYAGCTVAIDTYCWIYRGAFSCAEDLAMGTPTDGFVNLLR